MKKKYIAPDLYFESFVLSQSIAAGCATQGIALTKEYHDLYGYFNKTSPDSRLGDCDTDWSTVEDDYEGYCYWSGSMKLFLS